MLKADGDAYVQRLEELAKEFEGKEIELEDIIYDFDDSDVRLDAMMLCKLMPRMESLRIFEDISLAEKDPELKPWGGVLFRQEHFLETAKRFYRERQAEQARPGNAHSGDANLESESTRRSGRT